MPTVKPIPEGYHSITPNLIVPNGDQAIDFYKRAFGATELSRMPGPGGGVLHAELKIGNSIFMLGEENAEMGSKSPKTLGGTPLSLYIYVENVDQAWERALKAGATANMPLADMFWGDRAGWLTDPFGHAWALAQHVKDLSPEEIRKGQEAFFAEHASK
jgi:PhnB protein